MKKFKSVYELITELKPSDPVYCIRKKSIKKASKYFIKNFPGKISFIITNYRNTKKTLYFMQIMKMSFIKKYMENH